MTDRLEDERSGQTAGGAGVKCRVQLKSEILKFKQIPSTSLSGDVDGRERPFQETLMVGNDNLIPEGSYLYNSIQQNEIQLHRSCTWLTCFGFANCWQASNIQISSTSLSGDVDGREWREMII